MRALAVFCLVAACGNDPGLLLDVDPGSPAVARVEVFLPKDAAGDGLGLPPNGMTKRDGTIYEVVDSIAADRDSSGRVRILLQPGDLTDVPALLVLGYDGNHTPIASAVVTDPSGAIHLPSSTAVQLKVSLAAASYVPAATAGPASSAVQIARWSETSPGGDLDGPCIAVLGGGGDNTFFSAEGDLDCDGAEPECDDTRYRYTEPVSTPPDNAVCASKTLDPATMDACRLGQTISCTDDMGTCAPRMAGGNTELPICVPETLCEHCPNSDDTTGTSGIDASCEMDTRMDPKTLRLECTLAVTQPAQGVYQPCPAPPTPVDFTDDFGPGWICAGAPLGFLTAYSQTVQPQPIRIGGNATAPDYLIGAHCPGQPSIEISYDALPGGNAGPVSGDELGVLVLGVRDGSSSVSTPSDVLGVPFRLAYQPISDGCPAQPLSCKIVAPSGDPKDDPMWHCAGR